MRFYPFSGYNEYMIAIQGGAQQYNCHRTSFHQFSIGNATNSNYETLLLISSAGLISTYNVSAPNITTLTNNSTTNTTNIGTLQTQVQTILSKYVESITVGTTSDLYSGDNARVEYDITSTPQNVVLDFFIPRGADGSNGSNGSKGDKGNTGDTGPSGPQGPVGDSSAATIAAGVSASAAVASAGSAGASAASAAASAGFAAESAANLAIVSTSITGMEASITTMQDEVAVLTTQVQNLDADVVTLNAKTTNMTAEGTSTFFLGSVGCEQLYVTTDIACEGIMKSNNYTSIVGSTQISGQSINIGTTEALVNTINIGGVSTITTISGLVNFTNPFNNYFAQF